VNAATPALAVTGMLVRWERTASSMAMARSRAARTEAPGTSSANSSPPSRAITSPRLKAPSIAVATPLSTVSPAAGPSESLTSFR
jgi:hypothetical protein